MEIVNLTSKVRAATRQRKGRALKSFLGALKELPPIWKLQLFGFTYKPAVYLALRSCCSRRQHYLIGCEGQCRKCLGDLLGYIIVT